jgi:hypothetical protein
MTINDLENLKKTFTGRTVTVEALRPELKRWANLTGRVIAFTGNGRALIQFNGADQAYYDIDPEYIRIAEPSAENS